MKKFFILLIFAVFSCTCWANDILHSFGLNLSHQYTTTTGGIHLDDWILQAELSGEFDYTLGPRDIFTLGMETNFAYGLCPEFGFYESSNNMIGFTLAPLVGATFAKENKELCIFQVEALPLQIQANFVIDNPYVIPVIHAKTGTRFNLFMGKGRVRHGIEGGVNFCLAGHANGNFYPDFEGYELYFGYRICLLNK